MKTGIGSRARLLAVLAAIASIAIASLSVHAQEELVVTVYGGTFEKAWRASVIEPFEKEHNAKVRVVIGLTMENLAKLRAGKDNPQLDVVTFDPPGAVPAARDGLLEPLDAGRIPNLKNLYDFAVEKDRLYASFLIANQGIAYNTRHVKQPPTSWDDLWRPDFKGRVVLPDITTSHGAFFVSMMGKVYGKGLFDTEPAFAKIKTLRPSVINFYSSHDQVAQLLNQGEAWIVPWTSDRSAVQIKAGAPIGFVVPKEGAIFWTSEMGIVKGTKRKPLAEKYVNFALSVQAQKANAETMFLGPTNKNVQLGPELAKALPYGAKLKELVAPDWEDLARHRDGWADRWNREIK